MPQIGERQHRAEAAAHERQVVAVEVGARPRIEERRRLERPRRGERAEHELRRGQHARLETQIGVGYARQDDQRAHAAELARAVHLRGQRLAGCRRFEDHEPQRAFEPRSGQATREFEQRGRPRGVARVDARADEDELGRTTRALADHALGGGAHAEAGLAQPLA